MCHLLRLGTERVSMEAIDGHSGACGHSNMGCLGGDSGGTHHCQPRNTQAKSV